MGRTLAPYSMQIEAIEARLQKFRRGLRKDDQDALDAILRSAKLQLQSGVLAASPNPFDSVALAALIEHERRLGAHEERLSACEDESEERQDLFEQLEDHADEREEQHGLVEEIAERVLGHEERLDTTSREVLELREQLQALAKEFSAVRSMAL